MGAIYRNFSTLVPTATPLKPSHLKLLKVTTSASEPTLKQGRFFFTTPLKKPKRLDLISYRAILPDKGLALLTHRLCGLPGDSLEIKAGILYVNGQDADSQLQLKHVYKINRKDSGSLIYDKTQAYTIPPYTDTLYISLEDKYVHASQLSCERYTLPAGLRDEAIYLVYKKNWNRDNFGPIRIPSGRYFVLGDNRGQSIDSLNLGFIEQSKYVGTVLWKK
jgi:signal peptidase I